MMLLVTKSIKDNNAQYIINITREGEWWKQDLRMEWFV